MTKEQIQEWQKIETEIYSAFKYVALEDGIGYYEAEAIDNFWHPSESRYQAEREKDERFDWTKLLDDFSNNHLGSFPHCFMDAKGLRFYLPFLMIRQADCINDIMYFYISELYGRAGYSATAFTKTVSLLNKEQKQGIYHFYQFLNEINHTSFTNDELNYFFDTGEDKMRGFDFMEFVKQQFNEKNLG